MKNLVFASLILITALACNPTEEVKSIDLVAKDLIFSGEGFDAAMQDFDGVVTVKGYIVNEGSDNFVSGTEQQSIDISVFSETKAVVEFARLNAGDTLWVSYSFNWSMSTEFAPDFDLWINYDPDIFLDGNLDNDDLNLYNNHIKESGNQIYNL